MGFSEMGCFPGIETLRRQKGRRLVEKGRSKTVDSGGHKGPKKANLVEGKCGWGRKATRSVYSFRKRGNQKGEAFDATNGDAKFVKSERATGKEGGGVNWEGGRKGRHGGVDCRNCYV